MRMPLFATVAVATLALANAATAQNFNQLLRGTFSETGTDTCLFTGASGFDANLKPVSGGINIILARSTLGTRVFNGDGTGSVDFTLVHTPLVAPNNSTSLSSRIQSVHATADFTYEVAEDLTVTITTGPVTATVIAPPDLAGGTNTVDQVVTTGQLSQDHKSLTQAAPTNLPAENPSLLVEKGTFPNGSQLFRICSRSLVLFKVSDQTD